MVRTFCQINDRYLDYYFVTLIRDKEAASETEKGGVYLVFISDVQGLEYKQILKSHKVLKWYKNVKKQLYYLNHK